MKMLIAVAIALLIAVGVYYYIFMVMQAEEENIEEERGAAVNLQVNNIPAGAMMEDGTLPE
jgi:uncharacterized membrane protein YdfJ with MMPL/SSD domain